jgi:hypothetical protein
MFGKQRQEDHDFEASSSKDTRPYLKNTIKMKGMGV